MSENRGSQAAQLEARFAPSSLDAGARTVEVVWSTGAPVLRRGWDGDYIEELDMAAASVDLSRLQAGAPVLNSHRGWNLGDVLGVVERAWLDGKEGRATLRFSERDEVAPIFEDIRAGILRNVSVGYEVSEWKESRRADGMKVRRAVRWQPAEISLVPVPADASAQVRAAEAPDAAPLGDLPATPSAARAAEEPTMANTAAPAQTDAPATVDPTEATRAAVQAERQRIADLRTAREQAERIGLAAAVAGAAERSAVESGATVDALRTILMERLAERDATIAAPTPRPTPITMGRSGDDPAELIEAMATAIAVRAHPGIAGTANQRFREFASLRPSDMLMELAAARGERISPRQRPALVARAFHSSSDFPLLLENAGNKMLEAGFAAAAPTYRMFFAQRSFNDFKAHSFLTAGDFPALQPLTEGGTIALGTISEKRERITATTYARGVMVTRQMLVNDDLGAFTDFGTMIGRRVADYENALAYALLNTASGAGPTLIEGNAAVFTTGRGNRAAAAAAISETTLDAGYAGIMAHESLDRLKLNLQPRYLVTGPAYRGAALRFTRASGRVVPEQSVNVPLYDGLEPIADANITGNNWYLFADPNAAPVYAYGYVGGATAPSIRVQDPVPGRDGVSVEVVHDFAVGALGWRGAWFNG
jgi:hypothetical protein